MPPSPALIRLKDRHRRNQLICGTKSVSPEITLFSQRNDLATPRYAVYTSKRFGNAVSRNRVKRVFREILNRIKPRLGGYDFIIVPRSVLQGMSGPALLSAVEKAFRKAGIIKDIEDS